MSESFLLVDLEHISTVTNCTRYETLRSTPWDPDKTCLQSGLRHRNGYHGHWGQVWGQAGQHPTVTMRGYCRSGAADHHTTHWNYHLTLEQYGMPPEGMFPEMSPDEMDAFAKAFATLAKWPHLIGHNSTGSGAGLSLVCEQLRRVVIYAPNSSSTSPSDPHHHVIRNIDEGRIL
jgi:hypothetical protein